MLKVASHVPCDVEVFVPFTEFLQHVPIIVSSLLTFIWMVK
jgi:hypothetical protein